MPAGDICVANIGTPVPLNYGFNRLTGMQLVDFTVPSTATTNPNMQIGMWDLGEGEQDGISTLWIDNILQFGFDPSGNEIGTSTLGVTPSDTTTTGTLVNFGYHNGNDAPLGSSPGSSATQQLIDPLWSYLGSLVTPLCYSRRAYYTIGWIPPTDGSSTLSPIGDFRGIRCRMFDGNGNQIGYAFTQNPIWHFVDAWLRRAIKPEWTIDAVAGPSALTSDEQARFNWESIAEAAADCDYILANGHPRFQGNYAFASGTTLAAMLEQMLLCCRGYQYEYAGQIYVRVDKPRASTFLLDANHLIPGTVTVDNAQVNANANRYVATYNELGLPAVATIATISRTSTTVVITTTEANPCAENDIIAVGGVVDPSFDAFYTVASVSGLTVTCNITGGVTASSTGGSIGYMESRFSQRTPELSHIQHQMAEGMILPPTSPGTRLKRVKVDYEFGNCTWDQQNRLLKYEIYRDLGLDQTPYLPPVGITLEAWAESVDANGNSLKAQLQGDVITLDPSVFYEFAGEYELMERYIYPFQGELQDISAGGSIGQFTTSGALVSATDEDSGAIKLVLRSYNPNVFFDVSDTPDASFATVPGELPYAGTGGAGFSVSGTITVSTPYAGPSPITDGPYSSLTYNSVILRFGNGVVLDYTSGGIGPLNAGSGYVLYVNDPTMSGGSVPLQVAPDGSWPSGPGIYILGTFGTPAIPESPGTNSYTLNLT